MASVNPKAALDHFGHVETFDPVLWPSGEDISTMLERHEIITHQPANFWQVSARWALLKKYNMLYDESLLAKGPIVVSNGERKLQFSHEDMEAINCFWTNAVQSLDLSNDLIDFFKNKTSNGRRLEWTTMNCPPSCQFTLHAHPNIELIYCSMGSLHEVRMDGSPLTTSFEKVDGRTVKGPNLTSLKRPWKFSTINEGDWLVNEVGSIHKSFTASKGDGCLLVVLWGGSHADIVDGPSALNVQSMVDKMDAKLSQCDCGKWEVIEETFLPDSERRGV
jgi:hypothetical protein